MPGKSEYTNLNEQYHHRFLTNESSYPLKPLTGLSASQDQDI